MCSSDLGGWSAERDVSLVSGKGVAEALESRGHAVTRFDPPQDLIAIAEGLKPTPDAVFNALHGTGGEDGTIQAVLDMLGIPYTHSGMRASAVAMDKPMAKRLVGTVGVPSPSGTVVTPAALAKGHPIPPPYVVKPVAEGSSVGVFIVTKEHARPPQELFRDDWQFGEKVMVERYIPGKELTCAVLGDRALDVIEIVPMTRFYDYEAKYATGGSKHVLPAQILPNVYQEVRRLSLAAHNALGCRGVSRADFRYDDRGTGELVCLEVNTQPGMTETSLVPELAAYAGITFDELVRWMVEDASINR